MARPSIKGVSETCRHDGSNGTEGTAPINGVPEYDHEVPVIIVGASPVGLLLALRPAQNSIRSIVVEKEAALNGTPGAIGYYGPVHEVFQEAGIYERVAREGMLSGGYVWRKIPVDETDSYGKPCAKRLGSVIGRNIMSQPGPNGTYQIGHYSIQLAQSRLAEIMLEEAAKTGLVEVLWSHEARSLSQDEEGVTVTAISSHGALCTLRGQYLAGCDGGKSEVRKLLGVRLAGHSWPERFVATDVLRTAPIVSDPPVHFVVDPKHWAVVTPLEHVEPGKPGLWRYSMAVPLHLDDDEMNPPLTDEQVLEPQYVDSLLRQIDGPRPSEHRVVRKSLYKMHQLLASTMHHGRCFLAGDAAHINNPIGGLGLCTRPVDADALHQALKIIFSLHSPPGQSHYPHMNATGPSSCLKSSSHLKIDPQAVFTRYSSERRRTFQDIIRPYSSANKARLHGGDLDETAR